SAATAAADEQEAKLRQLQQDLLAARERQAEVGEEFVKLLEQGVKGQEELTLPLVDAAIEAEAAYADKAQAALSSIIARSDVEQALNARSNQVRVADADNPDVPIILPSPRQTAIARLVERHPEAADKIRGVAATWESIEKSIKINDPNDLIRLLEGSGVLNFRIVVDPGELGAQERELRDRLQRVGPLNASGEQAR